jgi:hypothetical protein
MATTPNFNWSTPDNTGLVKNGALDIRTLGDSIDASMADLKGGTTGQVLSKTSNTDMDFTWVAQDDSNAIQNAIVDAKGDIIAATANDTPARLAVGTNGQVLTADSTAATGLKWASAASSFKGVRLVKTTGQATSTGAWTAITYDTETYDTDAFHSTSSNTSRITIPTGLAGYYLIYANIAWAANGSGQRGVKIYQNGSQDRWKQFQAANGGYGNFLTVADVYYLGVTDYIEIVAYQDSGGNLNVLGSDSNTGFGIFGATFLGA